jgi:hypothetical protein
MRPSALYYPRALESANLFLADQTLHEVRTKQLADNVRLGVHKTPLGLVTGLTSYNSLAKALVLITVTGIIFGH